MFVDADTNKDGLVSKASFSKLIDMATSLFRIYGYAPDDSERHKTENGKEQVRQTMFVFMDVKGISVNVHGKLYREHKKLKRIKNMSQYMVNVFYRVQDKSQKDELKY